MSKWVDLAELEHNLVESAVNALCGSGSITSECRRDADILLLAYARSTKTAILDREDYKQKLNQAYRYFEYQEPLPPELEKVINSR